MKVAYVLYRYPSLSQAFILREIRQLRELGFEIEPYAMRRAPADQLLAEADRREAESTVALLPLDLKGLVRAHFGAMRRSPGAYLRILLGALAEGGVDPKAIGREAGCFALAVFISERLHRSGCRHVHTHFAGTPSHVASLVAKLGNAAGDGERWTWSATVHGPVEFFELSRFRLRERAREAAFVAYVSGFAHDQLLTAIDSSQWHKLHLVRCGLDADEFDAGERGTDRADGPVALLTVGRQVHVKAQVVMIRALARLLERGIEAHLTMIGDGPLGDELKGLAADLGIADAITFAGALGQDDVPAHYRRADIFCLSSVAESLPVTLMEAMASGRPVVSTDVGGIAELVADGESGLLVASGDSDAFADALERLCGDAALRRRMGAAGRRRVREEFDVARWGSRLAELLREAGAAQGA